jgi:hypothetical protein
MKQQHLMSDQDQILILSRKIFAEIHTFLYDEDRSQMIIDNGRYLRDNYLNADTAPTVIQEKPDFELYLDYMWNSVREANLKSLPNTSVRSSILPHWSLPLQPRI